MTLSGIKWLTFMGHPVSHQILGKPYILIANVIFKKIVTVASRVVFETLLRNHHEIH